MPGEVRFFDGNMQYPPHMVWQYLEPRHVTRVEVLPIPLGVFAHEGTPKNLRVRIIFSDSMLYRVICMYMYNGIIVPMV